MEPKTQNKRIAMGRKIDTIFFAIEVKEEMTDTGTNIDLQIINFFLMAL